MHMYRGGRKECNDFSVHCVKPSFDHIPSNLVHIKATEWSTWCSIMVKFGGIFTKQKFALKILSQNWLSIPKMPYFAGHMRSMFHIKISFLTVWIDQGQSLLQNDTHIAHFDTIFCFQGSDKVTLFCKFFTHFHIFHRKLQNSMSYFLCFDEIYESNNNNYGK